MSHLYARTQNFLKNEFPRKRELFEQLATGQSPKTMMIACSDSRVNPNLLTQTDPGELFVVRNAGNLVAPYSESNAASGEWATIEYALHVLGVEEIVVCGHSDCGAIKARRGGESTGLAAVDAWLENAAKPEGESLDALIGRNVGLQLHNLMTHPDVRAAVDEGRLSLHGWVYHIGNGQVEQVPLHQTTPA